MKKITLLASLILLFSACGVKQTQNLLSSGNYDQAIDNAVSNLRTNKDKKGNQDYVYLLEEAFAKAKERDLNAINLLEKENNPANFEKNIQHLYSIKRASGKNQTLTSIETN